MPVKYFALKIIKFASGSGIISTSWERVKSLYYYLFTYDIYTKIFYIEIITSKKSNGSFFSVLYTSFHTTIFAM